MKSELFVWPCNEWSSKNSSGTSVSDVMSHVVEEMSVDSLTVHEESTLVEYLGNRVSTCFETSATGLCTAVQFKLTASNFSNKAL
jgi:hypothetical protein